MKRLLLSCAFVAVALCENWIAPPAGAEEWLTAQFAAKYVKPQSTDPKDVAFKRAVEKTDCLICHNSMKGKGATAYGREFKNLVRKRDLKNPQKVAAAFDKIAAMKSNRNDPNSPTFGELFQQGKLPPR